MFRLFVPPTHKPLTRSLDLAIDDQMVTLTIHRRKNARRLTLRVEEDQLKATAPPHMAQADIISFVRSKSDWINTRLVSYADIYQNKEPSILYHGMETAVKITPDYTGHRYHCRYSDQCLWLDRPQSPRISVARQLEKHLRKEAETSIRTFLHPILDQLDEAPVPISIRDQKSRWGSCSTTRKLSFSWRLIMAPPQVLRYVVIHEAAHLKHHNHGQEFWLLVHDLMPEYDMHRNWLKENQKHVMARLDRKLAGLESCSMPQMTI
ncbi:MAG: M48 family metallopeptidase [Candidatus Puniceispirillales bacterium]